MTTEAFSEIQQHLGGVIEVVILPEQAQDMSDIIDEVSPSQRNAIISRLSDDDLAQWMGGVSRLEAPARQAFFQDLAESLDTDQLLRVNGAVAYDPARNDFVSAIGSQAPSAVRTEFFEKAYSDYGDALSLTPENMQALLEARASEIRAVAEKNDIDPRALAAVIQWEFQENPRGRISDMVQEPLYGLWEPFGVKAGPFGNPNGGGIGWASIHTGIVSELRPGVSTEQTVNLRMNFGDAIELIAEEMDARATQYYEESGDRVDIRDNPAMLAWAYNEGKPSVERSARLQAELIVEHQRAGQEGDPVVRPDLSENDMAVWVQDNLGDFMAFHSGQWFADLNALPLQPTV